MNKKLNELFKNKLKTHTLSATSYINERGDLIKQDPKFYKLYDDDGGENDNIRENLQELVDMQDEKEKEYIASLLSAHSKQNQIPLPKREKDKRITLRKKHISNKPKRKTCRCK